ncbi:MAG: S8 family serine peptidase [Chthoniobacterales bacterium]
MNILSSLHLSRLRRILSTLLLGAGVGIALLILLPSAAWSSSGSAKALAPDSTSASQKVAPWVMEKTAAGDEAEFLVVLPQQADLRGADALTTKEAKGHYVRDLLWKTAQESQGSLLAWMKQHGIEHRSYYLVNAVWAKGNRDVAMALAARSDVARIEGNPLIQNVAEPLPPETVSAQPDAITAVEPGIVNTNAPLVWATGFTGQGVVVGAADTGYRWTHAVLKGHYRGWDGVTGNHDFNWHDSIHTGGGVCGPNSTTPCDDNGHGSHTAGTAVGDDGATNQVGMAPGAKWIGCRNMDQGAGTPARYIECMEFFLAPYPVAGTPAQGDPSKAPDVTTNSWGCPASEGCAAGTLQQAVEGQRAAGIVMVVAAGNSGSACSTVSDPPSLYDASYTVGALSTGTDTIASFSSRGPVTADGSLRRKPDISAPGTNTRSASRTSDTAYMSISGTSMATPHVAGAVALLLSARPALRGDVAGIRAALNQAAFHINSSGCDAGSPAASPNNVYGYGRLDVKAAVDSVLQITSAVSRKNHASIPYDLPLPLTGTPGIEPRNNNGAQTVVITFDRNVTTGSATIASGNATVAGSPTFSGNAMTVNLANVADAQTITLSLDNVTDGAGGFLPASSVRMSVLAADTSGDGFVNAADALQTRGHSGESTGATNFRFDLNLDGAVNGGDVLVARSRSGASL